MSKEASVALVPSPMAGGPRLTCMSPGLATRDVTPSCRRGARAYSVAPPLLCSLTFAVGPEPIENFRMIERHYFRDILIKSFDFNFGFCIPNSRNTWEAIYECAAAQRSPRRPAVSHFRHQPYGSVEHASCRAGCQLSMMSFGN